VVAEIGSGGVVPNEEDLDPILGDVASQLGDLERAIIEDC